MVQKHTTAQAPALVIRFDGPPGPEAGRFIECENIDGESVSIGEWREDWKHPGNWLLVIPIGFDGLDVMDQNVRRVIESHAERARHGFVKYGTTTERQDLPFSRWLQHAQEEAMDFTVYLERMKFALLDFDERERRIYQREKRLDEREGVHEREEPPGDSSGYGAKGLVFLRPSVPKSWWQFWRER